MDEIKPGDAILIRSGYGYYTTYIKYVERVTKTLIITQCGRYRKEGGLMVKSSDKRILRKATEQDIANHSAYENIIGYELKLSRVFSFGLGVDGMIKKKEEMESLLEKMLTEIRRMK